MTPEERLQEILRSEAQTIVPAGDGLAKIRARIAHRRRWRLWLLPSAALATAGALLAFFVLAPDERTTQTLRPAQTPSAAPADSYQGPAVWPFRNQAEAQAWDPKQMPWAEDPLEVGRHFLSDYLQVSDVTLRQDCVSCAVLAVVAEGRDIATLALAYYSVDGKHLYTVVNVTGEDLTVLTPSDGASVSSPLSVSGRITGVDENVQLRLLDADGRQVAQGGAPAGSEAPWRTTLTWSDGSWTHGALVARTGNLRDGATNRLVVVPVTQGSAPAGPTFSGLVDGHVSLYDGQSGSLVRQLTFPPSGKQDVEAAWAAGSVLWVRQGIGSSCGGELDLRTSDQTTTVGSSSTFRYRTPQLSGDGALLGWVEQPCDSSPYTLVVAPRPTAGVAAPARRIEGPTGSIVELLDVRDDGALLVLTNDREATGPGTIGIVPPGATKLEGLTPIAGEPACYLASGTAFDGDQVVGFQTCEDGIQLLRWAMDGTEQSKDRALAEKSPETISARAGVALVSRFGGEIATYSEGAFATLITPDPQHCSSTGDQKGCVKGPDW